jgi:glycosyltransferase involved in cell wall biosynthesis
VLKRSTVPSVSVVIPAYNGARYLPASIGSVLAQTFTDFELIIVDDGSTDNTRDVVEPYLNDPRVKYIHQTNRRLPGARNTGIRHSSSALIAFLDCDDAWLPRKLELQCQALQDPGYGACYGAARFLFGDDTTRIMPGKEREPADLYRELLFKNVMYGATSSIMVRRECFAKIGLFDERLVFCEDRDMWLRLAWRYRIKYIHDELIRFDRSRPDAMTRNHLLMAEGTIALLCNLESSVPVGLRYLMPRVRQKTLLRTSTLYLVGGRCREARRYALKGLVARRSFDAHTIKALKLVVKSLMPGRRPKARASLREGCA